MLKQAERLRSSGDFAAVRHKGRTQHGPLITLSWIANALKHPRFGFVVSKRVGPAVTRNLVKRRLRAMVHTHRSAISANADIVFTAKPPAAQATFAELEAEVQRLLRKTRLWQPHTAEDASPSPRPMEGEA